MNGSEKCVEFLRNQVRSSQRLCKSFLFPWHLTQLLAGCHHSGAPFANWVKTSCQVLIRPSLRTFMWGGSALVRAPCAAVSSAESIIDQGCPREHDTEYSDNSPFSSQGLLYPETSCTWEIEVVPHPHPRLKVTAVCLCLMFRLSLLKASCGVSCTK